MKFFLSVVFAFLISGAVFAQASVYKGVIKDKTSGENLAYVNIGVVNKNSGTVSDVNGRFQLVLDEKFDAETLRISLIGYKSITFNVADFKKLIVSNEVISLEKNVSELKEVVIRNKNLRDAFSEM